MHGCPRTCSLNGDWKALILTDGTLGRKGAAIVRNQTCVPRTRQAWIEISALSLSVRPRVGDLTLENCFLIGQSEIVYWYIE